MFPPPIHDLGPGNCLGGALVAGLGSSIFKGQGHVPSSMLLLVECNRPLQHGAHTVLFAGTLNSSCSFRMNFFLFCFVQSSGNLRKSDGVGAQLTGTCQQVLTSWCTVAVLPHWNVAPPFVFGTCDSPAALLTEVVWNVKAAGCSMSDYSQDQQELANQVLQSDIPALLGVGPTSSVDDVKRKFKGVCSGKPRAHSFGAALHVLESHRRRHVAGGRLRGRDTWRHIGALRYT